MFNINLIFLRIVMFFIIIFFIIGIWFFVREGRICIICWRVGVLIYVLVRCCVVRVVMCVVMVCRISERIVGVKRCLYG